MKNESWSPGHSLNKGYPYNGSESLRMLRHRPKLDLKEDNKIEISWDEEVFGKVEVESSERTPFEDFLMMRLYDFQEALSIAEGQVSDLLEELPFIPENYGFELAHKHTGIDQPPVRIYVSKYDGRYSLFRKSAPEGFDANVAAWTILKKNDDSTFHENEVIIPCDRIAYALFLAMGIKISNEEPIPFMTESIKPINGPSDGMKNNYFDVQFTRGNDIAHVKVEADTVSDALSRAKFHFETDVDFPFADILPEELSIVS